MGLPVHQSQNYVQWLKQRIAEKKSTHVVTINAEMCMQAQQDAQLRQFIESADLVAPDGSGVELFFRFAKGEQIRRYPGIELAADLLDSLGPDIKVAFYGGKPEVIEAAAAAWKKRSPNLNLAIVQHGYVKGGELQSFLEQLKQVQPDVVFVGLGVPRQEFWIAEHRHLCPHAIWLGVGGSYDIWSGKKARAPQLMRNAHLEWLYRLYQEPWRWRRMLALPHFVWASFWYQMTEKDDAKIG
ncbi:MAG: WecB/TagA/CpsF family glycosyltransferase [Cyanobacteria bacterium J06650_10]